MGQQKNAHFCDYPADPIERNSTHGHNPTEFSKRRAVDSHKAVVRHLVEELRIHPRLRGGRLGAIDLKQMFDTVLLVLLDADYNASRIYDAERPAVEALPD